MSEKYDDESAFFDIVNGKKDSSSNSPRPRPIQGASVRPNIDDEYFIRKANEKADANRWVGGVSPVYSKTIENPENVKREEAMTELVAKLAENSLKKRRSDIEFSSVQSRIGWQVQRQLEIEAFVAKREIEKKKMEKRKFLVKKVVAAALAVVMTAGIGTLVVKGDDIKEYVVQESTFHSAESCLIDNAKFLIKNSKLGGYDDNLGRFVVFDNKKEDYKALTSNGIEAIYTYKKVLGEEEFAKYIQTRVYNNGENAYHYKDFANYLEVNGFANEEEFFKAAREEIIKLYEEGGIIRMESGHSNASRGGK